MFAAVILAINYHLFMAHEKWKDILEEFGPVERKGFLMAAAILSIVGSAGLMVALAVTAP